mmetsp:Transcript_4555/g.15962  ORF Transcript_4555/g.15962 Transcript_4555/m.15962 type:complete len:213 (-) Transcript_4555:173-811(-)
MRQTRCGRPSRRRSRRAGLFRRRTRSSRTPRATCTRERTTWTCRGRDCCEGGRGGEKKGPCDTEREKKKKKKKTSLKVLVLSARTRPHEASASSSQSAKISSGSSRTNSCASSPSSSRFRALKYQLKPWTPPPCVGESVSRGCCRWTYLLCCFRGPLQSPSSWHSELSLCDRTLSLPVTKSVIFLRKFIWTVSRALHQQVRLYPLLRESVFE